MSKNRQAEVAAAQRQIDFSKFDYQLELQTSAGNILLDFEPQVAPGHCKNMLALAEIGFYNGLVFHRVISGFMIQGGCPAGSGMGGPGYTIPAEFNKLPHNPGVLSMARSNDPNSAGSQFFICLERVPHLDGQYTAFGNTANPESLAVVKAIGAVPTDGNDRPRKAVTINTARVIATPKAA
ncbi:MAG: peptidylprolyl isomerase [Pirellulales bacterium]|nr:peptidylprolyl isomerase [Pirellulales bacterium]